MLQDTKRVYPIGIISFKDSNQFILAYIHSKDNGETNHLRIELGILTEANSISLDLQILYNELITVVGYYPETGIRCMHPSMLINNNGDFVFSFIDDEYNKISITLQKSEIDVAKTFGCYVGKECNSCSDIKKPSCQSCSSNFEFINTSKTCNSCFDDKKSYFQNSKKCGCPVKNCTQCTPEGSCTLCDGESITHDGNCFPKGNLKLKSSKYTKNKKMLFLKFNQALAPPPSLKNLTYKFYDPNLPQNIALNLTLSYLNLTSFESIQAYDKATLSNLQYKSNDKSSYEAKVEFDENIDQVNLIIFNNPESKLIKSESKEEYFLEPFFIFEKMKLYKSRFEK